MPISANNDPHGIKLTWTEETPGTGFNVYRSEQSGGEANPPIVQIPAGTMEYVDTNGTPGTTYFYTVAATLNGVTGPMSNEVSAVFPTIPVAPVLTATVV